MLLRLRYYCLAFVTLWSATGLDTKAANAQAFQVSSAYWPIAKADGANSTTGTALFATKTASGSYSGSQLVFSTVLPVRRKGPTRVPTIPTIPVLALKPTSNVLPAPLQAGTVAKELPRCRLIPIGQRQAIFEPC
jgi:hypothetical protein